jgi:hypothetical protein
MVKRLCLLLAAGMSMTLASGDATARPRAENCVVYGPGCTGMYDKDSKGKTIVICCCEKSGGVDLDCFVGGSRRRTRHLYPNPGGIKTNPKGPMSVVPIGPRGRGPTPVTPIGPRTPVPTVIPRGR